MAAAGAEEKSEAGGAGSAASGGGGGKLLPILVGVNLLATVGMIAILFISFQKERKHTSIEDIAAHPAAHGEPAAGGHGGAEAKDAGHGKAGDHGGKEGDKKKAVDFGKMVTLEQFTVNLATPGSVAPKFVRVSISLEVPNADSEGEVNSKMPQVRNAIIDLFNSKRPSDLATADGRDYLKEEIRNALNGFLVTGKVKGVFFSNFALSS